MPYSQQLQDMEERLKLTEGTVRTLESSVTELENRGPLGLTGRQIAVGTCGIIGLVFAAGVWAQSIDSTMKALSAEQTRSATTMDAIAQDLKQLYRLDRLEDRIQRAEKLIDKLEDQHNGNK